MFAIIMVEEIELCSAVLQNQKVDFLNAIWSHQLPVEMKHARCLHLQANSLINAGGTKWRLRIRPFDFEFKIKTFDFEFKIKSQQKFLASVTVLR